MVIGLGEGIPTGGYGAPGGSVFLSLLPTDVNNGEASVITGMMALAYLSGLLGLGGLVFTAIGLISPHLIETILALFGVGH